MRLLLAALPALALALGACNTGFSPQYLVTDLRVLGVRAHAEGRDLDADVTLADALALEALFWNPRDPGGVTVTWYGCVPQASELLPPCADPEFLAHPERLAAAAAAPPEARVVEHLGACVPGDAVPDRCGISVALPQPAAVQEALDFVLDVAVVDPAFRCRLYAQLPVVAIVEAGGRSALALKWVRILPTDAELEARGLKPPGVAQDANRNPEIYGVFRAPLDRDTCGGATVVGDPFPAGGTVVCALSPSPPQEFATCGPDGPERTSESLQWQWYTTGGEFPEEGGVGDATGGELDFVRPGGAFRLWTILRDGRGGAAWARQDLAALP